MPVNLERNAPYTAHNIPVSQEGYYRGVVADSYEDLWEVTDDGGETMRGKGKGGSDRLSFQRSYPNDQYVNGMVKANMIIEGDVRLPIDHFDERSGYAYVSPLDRERVESGEVPLRVYVRRPLGEEALHMVNEWHKIFDSFPSSGN